MKANIDEIEKVTLLLLLKLRESKGNVIEINNDFYWDIPADELYNPYEEPKNIGLGQLSDDLNEIKRLTMAFDVTPYDLKRLASILKALSLENPAAF